jgi:hypothetical protein
LYLAVVTLQSPEIPCKNEEELHGVKKGEECLNYIKTKAGEMNR